MAKIPSRKFSRTGRDSASKGSPSRRANLRPEESPRGRLRLRHEDLPKHRKKQREEAGCLGQSKTARSMNNHGEDRLAALQDQVAALKPASDL